MAESRAFQIAVLISGQGSNLQALIDAVRSGTLDARIQCVIADRPAHGLERARHAAIPVFQLKRGPGLSKELDAILDERLDLIVLAGFLSILSADFCHSWEGKIINLHPALLPKYGGMGMYGPRVHQAVIAHGEKESGATVHYVTSGVDTGEIIAQQKLKLAPGESPESLQEKIHRIEHPLLVGAIQKIMATRR